VGTSLVLFRISGIDVRVHWSFVLALAFGAYIYRDNPAGPLVGALYGMLVILLLFLCVTLHEFGHALTAKRFGVGVEHITLLPIGGVASLERMPDKPMQELLITVAGPLVNFVIALLLLPFTLLLLSMRFGSYPSNFASVVLQTMQQPGLTGLVSYLFITNILLGLFNLLPAFPMDGGRILRALLAMTMSYVRATNIAVLVGRLMAVIFAIFGLVTGNILMMLIAFFVYVGGGAEREAVQSRAVLKHFTAAQALTHTAVNLYSTERLSRAVELIMSSYQADYPVLDLGSKFVGVIDVMLPAKEIPVVSPTTDLAEVWEAMAGNGARVVAVKNQHEFVGLLTLDDITEVFQVMGATISKTGRPTPSSSMPTTPTPKPTEHTAADA
jgi:Zn-dependent protease